MVCRLLFIVCFFFFLSMGRNSFAATVLKFNNKFVLIETNNEVFEVGQTLRVEQADGKLVALLKVKSVKERGEKNQRVLAEILRGQVAKGLSVKLAKVRLSDQRKRWGLLTGAAMDFANIDTPSGSEKLKGFGYGVGGIFDLKMVDRFWVRAMTGVSQFAPSGENHCGGTCSVDITYFHLGGWGRVPFQQMMWSPWVGLGFELLYPISKSSTVLDSGSIKATSLLLLGGGVDIPLTSSSWIPLQVEYGSAPSSNKVKASSVALRVGYSMAF